MVTLDMEHVLILAIVVFVLYHFMDRCQCNGFSVGGQGLNASCVCSGQTNSDGEGDSDCLSQDRWGRWCYTKVGACGDKGWPSNDLDNTDWSNKACNNVRELRCPPDSYIFNDPQYEPICQCNEFWNKTFNENLKCVSILSLSEEELGPSAIFTYPCPEGKVFTSRGTSFGCE